MTDFSSSLRNEIEFQFLNSTRYILLNSKRQLQIEYVGRKLEARTDFYGTGRTDWMPEVSSPISKRKEKKKKDSFWALCEEES